VSSLFTITDPALRQKLGSQAAEYAKEYAWPLIAERIVKMYETVSNRQGDKVKG